MEDVRKAIGAYLKQRRGAACLSQEAVRDSTGIGQPRLSRLETGHALPLARELALLEPLLDLDMDWINRKLRGEPEADAQAAS